MWRVKCRFSSALLPLGLLFQAVALLIFQLGIRKYQNCGKGPVNVPYAAAATVFTFGKHHLR